MLAFVIHRKVERLLLQSRPDANPYRNVKYRYYILLYEKIKGDCLVTAIPNLKLKPAQCLQSSSFDPSTGSGHRFAFLPKLPSPERRAKRILRSPQSKDAPLRTWTLVLARLAQNRLLDLELLGF
jgi:hypothetical protein